MSIHCFVSATQLSNLELEFGFAVKLQSNLQQLLFSM